MISTCVQTHLNDFYVCFWKATFFRLRSLSVICWHRRRTSRFKKIRHAKLIVLITIIEYCGQIEAPWLISSEKFAEREKMFSVGSWLSKSEENTARGHPKMYPTGNKKKVPLPRNARGRSRGRGDLRASRDAIRCRLRRFWRSVFSCIGTVLLHVKK